MRCAAMIRPIVLAILACALTTHDAAGQGAGGSLLVGTVGDDVLIGTDGDDILDPLTASPGGEDVVQGALGDDILALPGVPWHYVFAAEGLGFRVTGPSDVNALVEEVERVAFGVTGEQLAAGATPLAIVESAALLPGSSADGVGRPPIALSDTVGGARGASRVVIDLNDLLRNDYDPDYNAQTLTGLDVTFTSLIDSVTVLLDPTAIEAAGYEWVLYPLGLLVVDLDGTLTSDVTLRYRTRMTLQGTTFIDQSSEATVTIAPVGAVNDRVLGSFGGETFIPYARLLANDGPGAVFDRIFNEYVFGGTIVDDPARGGIVIDFPGFYPNDGSFEYAIAGSSERALVEVELRNSPPIAAAMARVVGPATSFTLTFDEIRQHFGNFDPDGGNDFLVEVTGPTNTNGVTFQVFEDRVELSFPQGYAGGFVLGYTLSDQRLNARSLPSTISFLTTAPPAPTAVRDVLDWGINGDVLALFPGYRRGFGQIYARELLANDTAMSGSVVAPATPLDITPVGENPCPEFCTAREHLVLRSIGEGIPGFEGATSRSDLRFGFQFQRDFIGPETFSYTVVDPLGRTAPGLLTLRVNIHQPVLLDNVITIPTGATSVTVTADEILANDTFIGTGAIAQINANALIQVVDSGMPIGGGKTEITSFTFTPDTTYQPLESFVFYVLVYDTAAAGGSASGWQTVRFQREGTAPPTVVAWQSTSAGAIAEGGLHQIQIRRTGDLAAASTVTFAIRGGTATTDDIGLVRGTSGLGGFADLGTGFGTYSLTFNPGVDYVLLAVASAQDSAVEPDETFVLELLSATGATLGDPSLATGTILNDDVLPTITITGIQEGATVTIASPTVTITSDEPLTVVDCTLDIVRDDGPTSSNPVGCLAVPPVTSGQFTFPELPDGRVTLTVVGQDAAGNSTTVTRSFSVQVDPVVSIAAPANGATYQQGQVPALAYTCSDNSGVIASQTPSLGVNGDPWPGAPPSTPGTWRINVDCVDGSGNGGTASVTYTVVADTTPPDTQLVGEGTTVGFRDDGSAGSVPSFTFSGSDAEPGPVTFECRVTTFRTIVTFPSVLPDPPAPPDPQPSWAACTSPFTLSGLVEGAYTFSVRAVDAAGNQDATPPSLTFTVDRTAPLVAFAPVGVVLANGATVTADQVPTQLDRGCADVLISGYRFEASDRGLEADTTLAAPVHAVVGGWTLPRTLGTHSTTVSCTNTSGLTTTATFTYTVAEPPPPPPPCASDLSGILSVTKGPIRYVWVRQRFEQAVTLTNTTNAAIPAPLDVALALDGLGTHVTMVNASGVTACAAPAGSPYIVVPTQPGRQWGPGERVTLTLAFTTTQNLAITFTTRVLGGTSR